MKIKVILSSVGLAKATMARWEGKLYRLNRIHVPLEGKALFHDVKSDQLLIPDSAFLIINNSCVNFELLPNTQYYHMYMDFRTIPPLRPSEMVEVDLSRDEYFLYLLKAIQTLIQENIREHNKFNITEKRDGPVFTQVQNLLQVMLLHLNRKYGVTTIDNPKIERAIQFIDEHYAEQISNEDIAAELHIDTRYLIRLFTKHMGVPPYQYLTQCRVERAIEELRRGKTVTETAFLCGYQSENAFRIAFKRVMGCSPKTVQK